MLCSKLSDGAGRRRIDIELGEHGISVHRPTSATVTAMVNQDRISFVLTSEVLGGGELFTIRLASAIAKKMPVQIVGSENSPVMLAARRAGLETTSLELGRKLGARTAIRNFLHFRASQITLDRFIRENPDDLIVFQYKWEELLWGGRHSRDRVAILEHGPVPPKLAQVGWARQRLAKAFNRAGTIFAVSSPARDSIVEISSREPALVQAGVDSDLADSAIASRVHVRAELGIAEDSQVVAFVGRITLDKGILEAVRVLSRKPKLELLVCGEGEGLDEAQALAIELGVDQRVHWLGWREDAYAILAAAEVLVLLSTSPGEGRPLTALEALAVGTRTVAFDASPALVALAGEAKEIVLAPPGDAAALDHSLDQALEMERESVRLHTWDDTAASFLESLAPGNPEAPDGAGISEWRRQIHEFGSVVVLSTADFDAPLWTNKQHVATRLASEVPVVYIESLALRRPRLTLRDLTRVARRIRSLVGRPNDERASGPEIPERLQVLSPAVIPFHEFRIVRLINRRLFKAQTASALAGIPGPVLLWAYSPLAPEVLDLADFDATLFHCVDDLATVPGVPSELISRLERELATTSDLVVATSPPLFERLSQFNSNAKYFHNVVDVEHFTRPADTPPPPHDMENVPRPRAIFVGALSDHKIDWPLLGVTADECPGWSFVFVGPKGEEASQLSIESVERKDNVYFLGRRGYEDLPRYMWAADAGLIPYRLTRHTESIFPMKTLEYAAAEIHIISSPLPGVLAAKSDGLEVDIARDPAELAACLDRAHVASNRDYVERHTWDSLLSRILQSLVGKRSDDGADD